MRSLDLDSLMPPPARASTRRRGMSAAALATVLLLLLVLLLSAPAGTTSAGDDSCNISSSGACSSLSYMLLSALSPAPFPRSLVQLTNELHAQPSQFTRIFRRLKQVPCRGCRLKQHLL
jgi:hypothetical protein